MRLEQRDGGIPKENRSEFEKLQESIQDIGQVASEMGLKPFPTHFELVPPHIMYELGAYGLPGRFSHWTHGRAYHRMKTMYDYGLSKIYELVINGNPAQAFLLENNSLIQNKMVAAHVLAHVDFFANSLAYAGTNRQMVEGANLHAQRIKKAEFDHGEKEVEKFLDAALAIEMNFDQVRLEKPSPGDYLAQGKKRYLSTYEKKPTPSPFDDLLELGQPKKEKPAEIKVPFPPQEEQDLLWFIANFSPRGFEEWQEDVLLIVRNEMQYFLPQMRTKLMNEGWATFWHRRIMHRLEEKDKLEPGEDLEWIGLHAGVAHSSPTEVNPYFVGWKMWEDIERKFRGEPRPDGKKEKNWMGEEIDPYHFKGNEQYDPFWVRENVLSDQDFLRSYLTPALIEDLDLYTFGFDGEDWVVKEKDPEAVKTHMINSLTNCGAPVINVAVGGGDYNGNKELYLRHAWEGLNLDLSWATKTLPYIHSLWGRAVHLETETKDGKILLTCEDGKETEIEKI